MKSNFKHKVLNSLSWIVTIGSILLGIYIGGWLLFVSPIISLVLGFQAGSLTAGLIGWSIVKIVSAGFVGTIIGYVGFIIGVSIK